MSYSTKKIKPTLNNLFEWAEHQPDLLTEWLNQEVEQIIQNAPPKHRRRLKGLQFKIEMERQKAKHPMASCLAITTLMYDSVYDLQQALKGKDHQKQIIESEKKVSNVLPFKTNPVNNKSDK